ncbi:MAG: M28 family peptidase [Planctomycetota bacterium]
MRAVLTFAFLARLASAEEAEILAHDIVLRLRPAQATFVSYDTVRVRGPGRLCVAAPDGIEVEGGNVDVPEGVHEARVRFRGRVPRPAAVAGDRTAGTLGPEGGHLARGFYVPGRRPSRFTLTIGVPPPHHAVAPGRRTDEWEDDGLRFVTYEGSHPGDGLVVVTGPWRIDEMTRDGVACRTYLRAEDRGHAALLLASLRAEVARFEKVFGPVPDGRFDVVASSKSGHGHAGFALLGDALLRSLCADTVRAGKKTLPAGYLDHALVHAWLGHHLLVDHDQGDWSEALTTYFTTYGASERDGTDAGYRRKVARRYSLLVSPENDHPLAGPEKRRLPDDIGHGKGAMVFHMLARELGRKRFVEAVRHTVRTRGGLRLGWPGLVRALGEGAGRDLKLWFEPWLDRAGAPVLELGILKVQGNRVTGTIRQTQAGPAYPLRVPVRVSTGAGVESHIVASASKETAFSIETQSPPRKLALDPDHHLFRRIPRDRVAPCLALVLTAPQRVGYGDPELLARLKVEQAQGEPPADAALLAIGLPREIRQTLVRGARRRDASLAIEPGRFAFRGQVYDRPDDAILFSFRLPEAPPVTFFHGNGEAARAPMRHLPDHALDSWVVFRAGRAVARGTFAADRAARAEITRAREGAAESLVRDLLFLTDAVHDGRQAGTVSAYKLANRLRGRLHAAGLEVLTWPAVPVPQGRVEGPRAVIVLDGEQRVTLPGSFFPFHLSGSPRMAPVFRRVVEHPADQVAEALVLLPEDAPHDLARRYADRGAAAVAVVARDEAFTARGREAVWPGAMPPSLRERYPPERTNLAVVVSGLLARAPGPPLAIPYLYLHPGAAAVLRRRRAGGVLEYRLRRGDQQTSNVIGVLGNAKERGVLLSAHWDGVGRIGGRPVQGASDNAAGVAVVLWVAERLKRDAGKLRRPVIVALYGGTETGLAGSRQLVRALRSPGCPLAKPLAAVNVDGVGSFGRDQVYLIGRAHHPELLAAFRTARRGSGLVLGRDRDRFAPAGSSFDHWPLHQVGVPAVTLFSAHRGAVRGPLDTVDLVDVEMMRRVAKVVYRMVRDLASGDPLR